MSGSDTLHASYNRGIPVITPVHLQRQNDEDATICRSDFSAGTIRRAFIRKVYTLLMVQMVVIFGFLYFCTYHFDMNKFIREKRMLSLMILLVDSLVLAAVGLALGCCENARRKFPFNYVLLVLLTVGMAILMGFLAGLLPPRIITLSAAGTAVTCLVLTLFAFQTKIDFTTRSGTIAAFTSSVLFFGIIAAVTKSNHLDLVFSIVSVFLASCYLVYDTQLIVGGKHKFAFHPDDYVFATLCLFSDIIGIFVALVEILSANERRERNDN